MASRQETRRAAANLCALSGKLHLVDGLVRILNSSAQHWQQQQQQQQQVVRDVSAELLRLLQQHLRRDLLPLLWASPATAAAVAMLEGDTHPWTRFCKLIGSLCSSGDDDGYDDDDGEDDDDNDDAGYYAPSAVLAGVLLEAAASATDTGSLQQQQQQLHQLLFGLLLSFTKAVVHCSQLPATQGCVG